ncbi:tail fiber domain-containing protein [Limosilactobacillus fermentum]|uniref:tail fiber domain-containing protein n=1 Tax=Limosilactobacillus fermentum TaxID=1613 RepID=UPI003D77CBD9
MLYRQIILEWGQDTESGVWGLGYSPDNGKNFYVLNTTHGRKYRAEDGNRLYPYISDQIQDKIDTVVAPAKSAADSAQSAADAAVASAQVTSDAVSAIASATAEAKQGANDAMSRAKSAWDVATGAKEAVTDFDPLLKSAQSDADKALTQIADTVSALSDAKTAFGSDVAAAKELASMAQTTANSAVESADENAKALTSQANALSDARRAMDSDIANTKELANTAQATADNAVKSASSVADDLAAVANQAKANASGITKVTSDVGLLQTTVADNSGNISKIQETATQIQQAVSDNAGNITIAKQTADSAVTVASDAKSNATVAMQTASGASVTAKNAQGDATTAITTAQSAVTQASDAKSNATIAVQTASEASVTATNAQGDASFAKQTASDASVQIKNAQGDISKLQTRAGKIEASVATNSGAIANVQVTANQIKASVSDNAGNITTAKQTADSAVAVASDARSNATVAIQTASQASITASNASGQAASAVLTANGAMATASDAKSDATVAIQTASGASLTATNANSDATIAKQTASEAIVQASNAESDFAQISIRANKIEANVATNSGAIASVQQTASGLTTTVGKVDDRVKAIEDKTNWITKTGSLDMNTLTTTQNIYYRDTNLQNADGEAGWAYIQVVSVGERVTQTVWHDRSSIQHTRTGAVSGSSYNWDAWNLTATNAQVMEVKQTIDGVATTINDPKTGLNATYQTAQGNASTISNVKGDVAQLQTTANGLTSRVGDLESKSATQQTEFDQTKAAILQLAKQTDVDTLKGTVSQNTAALKTQADEIKNKVTRSDVTGMLTGYATQDYTQSLVTQKADEWNVNLTKLKNDTQTSLTQLAVGVEGVQAQVYNSDGSSKITQLSNLIATKVSQDDYNSQITQLKNDINLRVAKGDVISQINQEAGGDTLIQVSNGKKSLILDAGNTIITGKAWIPDAAISSISADKIMLGSSALYNSDGTLNLVNQSNGLKALIQVKQGLVQNTTQSIISFSSDYNNRAFSVTPVGATITPTLFFERYDQTAGHWLGFTRNEVRRDGLMFHTWDDEGERFFVGCHARFDRNISVDGNIYQGTWNGTTGKPLAGVLSIQSGNTIWSGSDYLAIGDHLSNSFTNVMARSFSQQSTLSSKTNIETVDPKDALDLVNRTDIRSYQYKTDVAQGKTKRYASLIIDDVNDVSQYCAPDEFTNEERTGRDDGSAVGYLFLAVKELTRRIKNLEEKLNG